jgi:hypothetical protein
MVAQDRNSTILDKILLIALTHVARVGPCSGAALSVIGCPSLRRSQVRNPEVYAARAGCSCPLRTVSERRMLN